MTRWENPLTRRYYQAAVQQNLFGDWEVMCIWGGIGSARGRQWVVPVDQQAADAELARIAARRAQRGYQRVDGLS
jgi:predicted DNA-binding WGR domain protein